MDAGTPKKLMIPANVVIARKADSPEVATQKARNATIQLREANNSRV